MAYIGSQPANKPVVASDLDPAVITGQTALAVAPADTDEFLLSDAGTLKRIDYSLLKATPHKTLLLTTTISSSTANITVNNSYITSSFRDYYFTISNLRTVNDGVNIMLRYSTDNGSSFLTSSYDVAVRGYRSDDSTEKDNNENGAEIRISVPDIGNGTGENFNMGAYMYNFLATDNRKFLRFNSAFNDNSGHGISEHGMGFHNSNTAVNCFKIYASSDNISACVFKFYGIT